MTPEASARINASLPSPPAPPSPPRAATADPAPAYLQPPLFSPLGYQEHKDYWSRRRDGQRSAGRLIPELRGNI